MFLVEEETHVRVCALEKNVRISWQDVGIVRKVLHGAKGGDLAQRIGPSFELVPSSRENEKGSNHLGCCPLIDNPHNSLWGCFEG